MKHIYILILFSFSFNNLVIINAVKECCKGENVVVNGLCLDNSPIMKLTCLNKMLLSSTEKEELVFEIDEDNILIITNDERLGSAIFEPDKYCMTKDANGSTSALVCTVNVKDPESSKYNLAQIIFLIVRALCYFISTVFLVVTLIVYVCLPELQDIEGKCIINFMVAMALTHFLSFIGPIIILFAPSTCDTISFINNTSLLCIFNWLTVLSFHIWRITIRPIFQGHLNWFLIYLCYGYGIPLILLITALVSHFTQDLELRILENLQCWLQESMSVWFYFNGPCCIMIVVCTVSLIWAAKKLWWDINRRDRSQSVIRLRKKCLMYLHMLLILALTMIIELSCIPFQHSKEMYIHYIIAVSDCRNGLIGGVTFFIFIALRKKVLIALSKHGLCCIKFPKEWKKLVDEELEEKESEEAALTHYNTDGL